MLRTAAADDAFDERRRDWIQTRVRGFRDLVREMVTGARYLALQLRPPELDEAGFENALRSYVAEWGRRYAVEVDVMVNGVWNGPLPDLVGATLYRIAQEALTNAAKHASARRVGVIVERGEESVSLIVEDDGCGFDVEREVEKARREHRLGLLGMNERASLAGGDVTVESLAGAGTTVFARFPIARAH